MACFSIPAYLQKPQASLVSSYLNKTNSISIHHLNDSKTKPLITTVVPRLSVKACCSSSSTTSDPVIVKKLNADNSSPSKTSSPWLMLTPEIKSSGTQTVFKFYSLADDRVITIDRKNLKYQLGLESEDRVDLRLKGSSHGWLVIFDRYSSDLFLYNPLSNRHLKLPTIRSLEAIPEKRPDCVTKVIISSSDPEVDLNCRALMIYGDHGNLAFCCPCPNSSSNEWIETYYRYDDVVCGDNNNMLFFGINDKKFYNDVHWPYPEFEGWDLRDLSRPRLISLEDHLEKDYGKTFPWKGYDFKAPWMYREANFLVAAHCTTKNNNHQQQPCDNKFQLYYVCLQGGDWNMWYRNKKMDFHFHVHKFDFENGKVFRMDRSLDGLAFFVGRNHSFALFASDERQLKPNSIYFTHPEDDHGYEDPPLGRHHIKIYNYEDGTFSPLYYTVKGAENTIQPPPVWYTPTAPLSSSF